MITTHIYGRSDEFAAEYARLNAFPALHESVPWLQYCDRRANGGMRYVAARGSQGELLGVTALRHTARASSASPNYDVTNVWFDDPGQLPAPKARFYPQLFAAVSGTHCLFRTLGGPEHEVRAKLVRAATDLADSDGSILTFAYLNDARLADELATLMRQSGSGVVGAQCVLEASWTDFDGYLTARPKGRRSNIRRERRQYLASGLRTRVDVSGSNLDERTARLQVLLADKYGVANSVDAVLRDYADLTATVADHIVTFTAERDGVAAGVCICLRDGETLHIRSVGFDYQRIGTDFVYFNLMFYEPMLWGAAHGIRRFCFGNGTYRAKQLRGCRLEPLYGLVRWPADLTTHCAGALGRRDRVARATLGLSTGSEGMPARTPPREWRNES